VGAGTGAIAVVGARAGDVNATGGDTVTGDDTFTVAIAIVELLKDLFIYIFFLILLYGLRLN
jgi:hypothetical protein